MQWLFQQRSTELQVTRIEVSYVEIYNEKVKDLLAASHGAKQPQTLEIRQDRAKGIHMPGVVEIEVMSESEVFDILWRGAKQRAIAATNMNEHSSRSHTVFTVRITSTTASGVVATAKISLVDLAGSEKWKSHQMSAFSEQRIKVCD